MKTNAGMQSLPMLVHTGLLPQVFAPGFNALDLTQQEAMRSPAGAMRAYAELGTIELDREAQ